MTGGAGSVGGRGAAPSVVKDGERQRQNDDQEMMVKGRDREV